MKYCTNCGKENSKRRCINCGAKQNSIHKFCGWCGIELNQNAFVCPNCHERIKKGAFVKISNIIGIILACLLAYCTIAAQNEYRFYYLIPLAIIIFLLTPFAISLIQNNSKKPIKLLLHIARIALIIILFFHLAN